MPFGAGPLVLPLGLFVIPTILQSTWYLDDWKIVREKFDIYHLLRVFPRTTTGLLPLTRTLLNAVSLVYEDQCSSFGAEIVRRRYRNECG